MPILIDRLADCVTFAHHRTTMRYIRGRHVKAAGYRAIELSDLIRSECAGCSCAGPGWGSPPGRSAAPPRGKRSRRAFSAPTRYSRPVITRASGLARRRAETVHTGVGRDAETPRAAGDTRGPPRCPTSPRQPAPWREYYGADLTSARPGTRPGAGHFRAAAARPSLASLRHLPFSSLATTLAGAASVSASSAYGRPGRPGARVVRSAGSGSSRYRTPSTPRVAAAFSKAPPGPRPRPDEGKMAAGAMFGDLAGTGVTG